MSGWDMSLRTNPARDSSTDRHTSTNRAMIHRPSHRSILTATPLTFAGIAALTIPLAAQSVEEGKESVLAHAAALDGLVAEM